MISGLPVTRLLMLFDDESDDETMDTETAEQDLLMQNRFIEEHQYQMMRDNSE